MKLRELLEAQGLDPQALLDVEVGARDPIGTTVTASITEDGLEVTFNVAPRQQRREAARDA